jgi:hypothetical protein
MQHFIDNLLHSKAPLMVMLRSVLILLIIFMGVARLRIIFALLANPDSFVDRDLMTYYLMAKAYLAHSNPYLPVNELAQRFLGATSDLVHPAPCTPVMILLFIPLSFLSLGNAIVTWFVIELTLLGAISYMLTILWSGKGNIPGSILIFLISLAWYPVMVDLLYGQLTILLTALILAALLALHKDKKILAGVFLGFSMAVKMYTWPLILYFAIKKDWRTFIISCLTFIGFNLTAIIVLGIHPVLEYYFRVTAQVSSIYDSFLQNYSLWSIGFRFLEGTSPTGGEFISAPPLINLPGLAPFLSAGLVILFLALGLIWANRSKKLDIPYSIMICVLILISPITWDHYYFMAIIPMTVLLYELSRHSFPTWPTILFILLIFMLFFVNERIADLIYIFNSREILEANGYRITFWSGLLEILPMLEMVVLTALLWRFGVQQDKVPGSTGPVKG